MDAVEVVLSILSAVLIGGSILYCIVSVQCNKDDITRLERLLNHELVRTARRLALLEDDIDSTRRLVADHIVGTPTHTHDAKQLDSGPTDEEAERESIYYMNDPLL
jgi:hypothetical protein